MYDACDHTPVLVRRLRRRHPGDSARAHRCAYVMMKMCASARAHATLHASWPGAFGAGTR